MLKLTRYGIEYVEGQKCPSCSSEIDRGCVLMAMKRKRPFLKATICKYSVISDKTIRSGVRHFWRKVR